MSEHDKNALRMPEKEVESEFGRPVAKSQLAVSWRETKRSSTCAFLLLYSPALKREHSFLQTYFLKNNCFDWIACTEIHETSFKWTLMTAQGTCMIDQFNSRFPRELFRTVIEHLHWVDDRSALCDISLTSRILRSEGQRKLYNRIMFTQEDASRARHFFTIIAASPKRLALLVKICRIESVNPDLDKELLTLALKAMINLKSLHIQLVKCTAPTGLFLDYPFQLENLSIGFQVYDEALFTAFLLSQPKLKRLEINTLLPPPGFQLIRPSISPGLVVLIGDWDVMETFLPGRYITSLMLMPSEDDNLRDYFLPNSVELLSHELNQLVHFSCSAHRHLHCFIHHLQSVQTLELVDPTLQELALLAEIPNLQRLILKRWQKGLLFPLEKVAKRLYRLFSTCPTLQWIDLEIETNAFRRDKKFQRWARSSDEGQKILLSENEVRRWWRVI